MTRGCWYYGLTESSASSGLLLGEGRRRGSLPQSAPRAAALEAIAFAGAPRQSCQHLLPAIPPNHPRSTSPSQLPSLSQQVRTLSPCTSIWPLTLFTKLAKCSSVEQASYSQSQPKFKPNKPLHTRASFKAKWLSCRRGKGCGRGRGSTFCKGSHS